MSARRVEGQTRRPGSKAGRRNSVRSLDLTRAFPKPIRVVRMGLSRLARSTCCQRPLCFPPERCPSVEPQNQKRICCPRKPFNLTAIARKLSMRCNAPGFTSELDRRSAEERAERQARSAITRFSGRKTPRANSFQLKILGGLAIAAKPFGNLRSEY